MKILSRSALVSAAAALLLAAMAGCGGGDDDPPRQQTQVCLNCAGLSGNSLVLCRSQNASRSGC